MPIIHPDHHGRSVLGAQPAAVFREGLEDVPLEVTVNSERHVTTVDGFLHQLSGAGESNAISTFLVRRSAVDGTQARVIFTLNASEGFVSSEHAREVRRDGAKRVGALAHQVHLKPRIAQFSQNLSVLWTHALHQVGKVRLGVAVHCVEQLIRVRPCN